MKQDLSKSQQERRRLVYAALGVGAAALALRLPSLLGQGCIATDDYAYALVGRRIVTGHGITDFDGPHTVFPPGYPLVIGMAYLLTRELETAIRLANLLIGLGLVILVGVVAAGFWDARAGVFAAAFAAFNPSLIRSGIEGGSETTFALGSVAAVYLAAGAVRGSPLRGLACGAAIGALTLVRPEGGVYLPALILLLLVLKPTKKWMTAAASLAAAFLVVLPYSLFMHSVTGSWLPTGKSRSLVFDDPTLVKDREKVLFSIAPDGRRLTGELVDWRAAARQWRERPGRCAAKYAANLGRSVLRIGKAVWVPALVVLPFALLPLSELRKRRAALAASLIVLAVPAAVSLFVPKTRFLLGVVPIALLWSAAGLRNLPRMHWPERWARHRWLAAAAFGALVAASGVYGTHSGLVLRAQEYPEHKSAGLWLRQRGLGGLPVMSRKPYVSFYADAPWVCLPVASYERTIAYARTQRARFIVIDKRVVPDIRPQLAFLLDPHRAPRELRLLNVFDRGPDGKPAPRLVLYELLPGP